MVSHLSLERAQDIILLATLRDAREHPHCHQTRHDRELHQIIYSTAKSETPNIRRRLIRITAIDTANHCDIHLA